MYKNNYKKVEYNGKNYWIPVNKVIKGTAKQDLLTTMLKVSMKTELDKMDERWLALWQDIIFEVNKSRFKEYIKC